MKTPFIKDLEEGLSQVLAFGNMIVVFDSATFEIKYVALIRDVDSLGFEEQIKLKYLMTNLKHNNFPEGFLK